VAALLAALPAVDCVELSDGLFGRLSPVQTPSGILGLIPIPERRPPPVNPEACVLLEDVQDPGNLGSILRSTAAAGIRQVYLSAQCADLWSPKVLRAGMGAHFYLDCFAGVDLGGFAAAFPGRLIATHLAARQSVFATDLTGQIGLIFGNEGAGLSRSLLDAVDCVVAIPMPGGTESLNIAAAAAICLFERVRQLG
jgi:TrmH family RNA methyltransferase